ncbi:MAG: hypothetical protein ACPGD8_03425 [Flavobacteriales bacterium]
MRIIPLFILIILACGCKNRGCTDFNSENYDPDAAINDGSCILTRDKFLGEFEVNSNCFESVYMRSIVATQNEYIVVISNLADTLGDVEASVFGKNITIEPQSIASQIMIEGAGVYMDGDTISISYRVRDSRNGIEIVHDCLENCVKI